MVTNIGIPALLGLDWGTSSLRAYLISTDGQILDRRQGPFGALHIEKADFPTVLEKIALDWLKAYPALKIIACGMVGSTRGWLEVPYLPCPLDLKTLEQPLPSVTFELIGTPGQIWRLAIVPGLIQNFAGIADVMRGEETQILGAIQHLPRQSHYNFILPGTHSKWVEVALGRIERFQTFMTGELFALLMEHSLLGKDLADKYPVPTAMGIEEMSFKNGVRLAAGHSAAGLTALAFQARALVLSGRLTPAHAKNFLSGILIGYELVAGLRFLSQSKPALEKLPLYVVGDKALVERYTQALAWVDGKVVTAAITGDVVAEGLHAIAQKS